MLMRKAECMDKPNLSSHEISSQQAVLVQNLELSFNNQTIFSQLSFELTTGKTLFLEGPSGSGKSSLFKMLLGLICPGAGEIKVLGQQMSSRSVWSIRRQIGYMPQEPDPGSLTVREFIEHPFQYKANHDKSFSREKLEYWMDYFGLQPSLLDQSGTSLSGGQKQRFAFIFVILLDRPLILLDEPTSALDQSSRQALKRWITDQKDKTFLIISHDRDLQELKKQSIRIPDITGGRQ